MGLNRCGQVRQQVARLFAQGLDHTHDPFRKLAAPDAVATVGVLAPLNQTAQHPFGFVVGRFHALVRDERPQRAVLPHDPAGKIARFGRRRVLLCVQQGGFQLRSQGLDLKLQFRATDVPVFKPIPAFEDRGREVQSDLAQDFRAALECDHAGKVADQMRPAQLTVFQRQTVVGPKAVAVNDAGKVQIAKARL